ncbi:hypothetical protein TNCT_183351 [Trichonephila clavata]|uniref:Uncharacterized protein n=1 Tax=Trichonephila clavata TaxID=2740835 RepID=A0A8X6LW88_TRICU|nr:hypothetical protein TNCT_183351 [Trichonephila clavata]
MSLGHSSTESPPYLTSGFGLHFAQLSSESLLSLILSTLPLRHCSCCEIRSDSQGSEHVRAQDAADPRRHLRGRPGHAVENDPRPVPSRLQDQMTVALTPPATCGVFSITKSKITLGILIGALLK